jgi:hypothetical protein
LNAPLAARIDFAFEARPPPKRDWQFDELAGTKFEVVKELDKADRHLLIVWAEEVVVGSVASANGVFAPAFGRGQQSNFSLHGHVFWVSFRHATRLATLCPLSTQSRHYETLSYSPLPVLQAAG